MDNHTSPRSGSKCSVNCLEAKNKLLDVDGSRTAGKTLPSARNRVFFQGCCSGDKGEECHWNLSCFQKYTCSETGK